MNLRFVKNVVLDQVQFSIFQDKNLVLDGIYNLDNGQMYTEPGVDADPSTVELVADWIDDNTIALMPTGETAITV